MWIVVSLAVAFVVALLLAYYLATPSALVRILDLPNERSLHERPTPRTGGLGVLSGVMVSGGLVALTIGMAPVLLWIAAGVAMLAVVSLLDDWLKLPASARFLVQSVVAVAVVGAGLAPETIHLPGMSWVWPWSLGLGVSVLYTLWLVNLYNFMDGMDGFAGGMAIIGFTALGLIGWHAHAPMFAAVTWCVAASAAGFLVWNFPPARIFLGDSGSTTLGFLAASLSLWAARDGIVPLWVSVLVFSPFIVDSTVTLVRRLVSGERVWQAHCKHYYQRLARGGWGHRRTVLWEYALMVACALSAFIAVRSSASIQWSVLGGWLLIYLLVMRAIDARMPFPRKNMT